MVLVQNATPPFPAAANDSGTGLDGTVVNKQYIEDIRDSVNDLIHSAVNPTVTPENTTDEVVAARGTAASLSARLAGVIDTTAVGASNLAGNGEFVVWSTGDTVAPDYFSIVGGGLMQRCGTGLADTNTKIGDFCARLTYVAGQTTLKQTLLDAAAFTRAIAIRGRRVSAGMWVKTAVANQARIYIEDGFGNTFSSYHTGDGTWQWLTVTHAIGTGLSTILAFNASVEIAGAAYFSGLTVLMGASAPSDWLPCATIYRQDHFCITGVQTVANGKVPSEIWFPRSCIVREIALRTQTLPPTGADLIVRPNHWDGAAMQELFTAGGRPRILAGAGWGSALPDGTYRYRCFRGGNVTVNAITDALFNVDVTQIGSVQAGTDLHVFVRYLEYLRPFEVMLAPGNFS